MLENGQMKKNFRSFTDNISLRFKNYVENNSYHSISNQNMSLELSCLHSGSCVKQKNRTLERDLNYQTNSTVSFFFTFTL